MSNFYALILGVVQGLTEFLPVSSSGHLVIVQNMIPGFDQPGILFDVVLHAGTLLAVLVYFYKRIVRLDRSAYILLAIGTIPAVIVGFLLQDIIELLFGSVKVVGVALLITAVFNYLVDTVKPSSKKLGEKGSFTVGLFQAFAIIPGISRSGSTIFASVRQGIEKKKAAEFSFLLSIPVIFGATFIQLINYSPDAAGQTSFYLIGFVAAFLSGLLAIKIVFKTLLSGSFRIFAVYCFLLGVVVLVFM